MKFLLLLGFMMTAAPAFAGDNAWKDWKPVDPAQLAMKSSLVEKAADAEVIFWEVKVEYKPDRATLCNYIRIKILTDRGKESQSKVDLTYFAKNKIEDIAARTIKADGTIIELKNDAIFERIIVEAGGVKIKARSFAFPAVEVGDIIEYHWCEVRNDTFFLRLSLQRDIPIQSLRYSIKRPPRQARLNTRVYNGEISPLEANSDKYYNATLTNVPAIQVEPYMPPPDHVYTWMLVYQLPELTIFNTRNWFYEGLKPLLKVNDEVRKASETIIAGATTPAQKLHRLYEFCQTKIKNIDDDAPGLPVNGRVDLKDNKSSSDTLRRGYGSRLDINSLFVALATSAGFDAHAALIADRSQYYFDPRADDDFLNLYFLRNVIVAVKVDDRWLFFDPASKYTPYGMLPWQEESMKALVIGSYFQTSQATPLTPPEKSLQKRVAQLRLDEDGTLEGDVHIEYTGHFAVEKKQFNDEGSDKEREEMLRDMIKKQMSNAEVTNIVIENVTDPVKPFVYKYHVRVPGYAQRTGKRLFLQPAFFQHGLMPRFTTAERKHSINFNYPWSEEDTVTIELPDGFALDNAESPASTTASTVGKYDARVFITKDQRTLIYKRNFFFGGGGVIFFPSSTYGPLKQVFDAIHSWDNHTITLKQGQKPEPPK